MKSIDAQINIQEHLTQQTILIFRDAAVLWRLHRKYSKSCRVLRQLVIYGGDDELVFGGILKFLGNLEDQLGQYDQAIESFKSVMKLKHSAIRAQNVEIQGYIFDALLSQHKIEHCLIEYLRAKNLENETLKFHKPNCSCCQLKWDYSQIISTWLFTTISQFEAPFTQFYLKNWCNDQEFANQILGRNFSRKMFENRQNATESLPKDPLTIQKNYFKILESSILRGFFVESLGVQNSTERWEYSFKLLAGMKEESTRSKVLSFTVFSFFGISLLKKGNITQKSLFPLKIAVGPMHQIPILAKHVEALGKVLSYSKPVIAIWKKIFEFE